MNFITSLSSSGDTSDFLQRENFHLFIHLKEIVQSIFFFLVCLFVISMYDALLVGNYWQFVAIFGHSWPFFKCLIDMDILKPLLFLKFFLLITGHSMTKKSEKQN